MKNISGKKTQVITSTSAVEQKAELLVRRKITVIKNAAAQAPITVSEL
ncbi:MAG: hypothetical protein IIZ48_08455 [Erysipelotrichales bacterium]|nr:hypothetical protein [Erysipelotrichales bacterium]